VWYYFVYICTGSARQSIVGCSPRGSPGRTSAVLFRRWLCRFAFGNYSEGNYCLASALSTGHKSHDICGLTGHTAEFPTCPEAEASNQRVKVCLARTLSDVSLSLLLIPRSTTGNAQIRALRPAPPLRVYLRSVMKRGVLGERVELFERGSGGTPSDQRCLVSEPIRREHPVNGADLLEQGLAHLTVGVDERVGIVGLRFV
jgi:hypothetical protein